MDHSNLKCCVLQLCSFSLNLKCCAQQLCSLSHSLAGKALNALCFLTSNRLNMQAKAKIMVVRDIERDDIEYISKTLNCLPIAHVDHMKPEKLGHADRVDEVQVYLYVILLLLLSIACSDVIGQHCTICSRTAPKQWRFLYSCHAPRVWTKFL